MNSELIEALTSCETDIDGSLSRFYGNEELYISLLTSFVKEKTMDSLNAAVSRSDWDGAFMAAHALKGLSGNLGFIPLYHAIGEFIILLRKGKVNEIEATHEQIKYCYEQIIEAIGVLDKIES